MLHSISRSEKPKKNLNLFGPSNELLRMKCDNVNGCLRRLHILTLN